MEYANLALQCQKYSNLWYVLQGLMRFFTHSYVFLKLRWNKVLQQIVCLFIVFIFIYLIIYFQKEAFKESTTIY